MRKLNVFNLVTLDGYFTGVGGDISWHRVDEEFRAIAVEKACSGNTLLFGRVTYEMMYSYWTSPDGLKDDAEVARGMNASPKVVFSRTLRKADWENTRLARAGLLEDVRDLKKGSGKDLTVLGSGTIVAQLAEAGLVDEYQTMLVPAALGRGRTMFEGVKRKLSFRLTGLRRFSNGNVLLTHVPE